MNNEEVKRILEEAKNGNSELDSEILKKFEGQSKSIDTRYQYPYVQLEQVMANPDEYIIPACQPACKAL